MLKLEQQANPPAQGDAPIGLTESNAHKAYLTQMQKLRTWQVLGPLFEHPSEPDRVVFWCCPWGTNLARMVWTFCQLLVWPHPDHPPAHGDPGISWTELAFSFMLWSNRPLPIKLRDSSNTVLLQYHDLKVSTLPTKLKSVQVLAENFRWVVKHIQTFSKQTLIPQYRKQGSSSPIRLGFTSYHEGGVSRRPVLPNAEQTCAYLHGMLQTMPHNPPYHTEVDLPTLPSRVSSMAWPSWPEVLDSKRDSFLILVRNAMARKKHFDTIRHPVVD